MPTRSWHPHSLPVARRDRCLMHGSPHAKNTPHHNSVARWGENTVSEKDKRQQSRSVLAFRVAVTEMAIRGKNGGAAAAEVALGVVALLLVVATGSAQQVPDCASKLLPCANYLNTTTPPESCCGPLKQAAKDDTDCLCSIFNDKTVLQAFKVDIEQALQLAKKCGIDAGNSICAKSNATTTDSAPSVSNNTTASPEAKNVNSAVRGVAWIGMSGMVSLLLFWWSVRA
ncbi:uncharacterized protein [Elaeis guineensis]|uniref:Uncharacterized protein LOC105054574 isoform X2 n=2 Tax=Elaeis guineensis var. tenera TaxID=51953 RepID=A0A6I9RY20_ELAGV|nr:uncharacterized protein LOC105054574 isoform X2 [Elaeis guineensis]